MWYEIIAFLVALGFLAFLKYGKGSLSIIKLPFPVGGARGSASISSLSEEDLAEKRMSWYVILAVISALVAKMFGYTPAGIIALVGVHIVWWRYRKKGSSLTKLVVYGMLTFFVLAWLYPVEATKTRDTGIKIFGNAVAGASNTAESLAKGDESKASVSANGGTPASIMAMKERPSDWIRFPEHKSTAFHCNGNGVMYVRHNKTGSEGIGPFPCTPNGISRDLNMLQNGERVEQLEYLEVRFQSNGQPFLVNFKDCPTNTSCLMRVS